MNKRKGFPGLILILIMVLTIGGAFVCFGENNLSFAVGEKNAQSVDVGEAENKDKSTDTEQSEEPEAADDAALSDRVIEAEVTEAEIYINGEDGKKQSSDDLKAARTFWKSLTGRSAKLAENSGQERRAPVEFTVSGKLPDDVRAEIKYIEFDEDNKLDERALFAFELTLRDAAGNVYIPEEPVTVTVSGTRIKAAVEKERPVLVYSYAENTAREEEYAKTLSQDIYAADVLVYRDGSGSDEQLAYEKYDKNKEYKDGKDAVRYTEDEKGLAFTEDAEAVFDYDFSSDEEADAVQDGTARFVMSEQKSAEELSKEKASDPDEKKSDADKEKESEKSGTKSGKDSDKDGAGSAKKAVGKTVTASDNKKYKITASYGPEAGLPADIQLEARELKGLEYRQYRRAAAAAVGADKLEYARVFDITLVDRQGKEYQPDDNVSVTIELLNDENVPDELTVVHFDEKKKAEVLESETNDETVSFNTDGFSVYAVVSTVISETLTSSDGKHYKVTVEYDSDSGIPSYAKLKVSEIDENSDDYKAYVEKTAKTLGTKTEKLAFARAFDIKLVNPLTGRKYQPGKDVRVSIELLDQKVSSDEEIRVVHFGEKKGQADAANGSKASEIECGVKDGTVGFDTDGFSIFVLTETTYLGTYQFFSHNSFGDYQGYNFFDDQGNLVTSQTIKNGETLLAPHDPPANPNDPGAEFKGWYVGTGPSTNPTLADKPFDFDTPQALTADETINLYAVFSKFAHVTFHSQYDTTSQTDPVLEVMPVELTTSTVTVDISDKTTAYYSTSGSEHYEFYGWSLTAFHTPGEGTGEIITDLKNFAVSEDIDLYPVYRKVNYLTLSSGYTGTGATYYSPVAITAGGELTQSNIKSKYIPTRPGYIFEGWYLEVEKAGTIDQNGTGTQVTEADGTLKPVSTSEISTTTGDDGYLQLSTDVTLYARWGSTNVKYKIVVWQQRKTDAETLADKDKTWDYTERFVLQAKPYDEVSVAEDYRKLNEVNSYNALHPDATVTEDNNPYKNYSLNNGLSDTSEKTIDYEGTTVFNLYYDWTGSRVEPGTEAHTLTFMNSEAQYDQKIVNEGAVLKGYFPSDPPEQKPGYEFHWYLDSTCTTPVSDTTTMPNHDLTVYAGWEKEWYLIQIDPNYGSLNGNGSTYFWKTYKSDYIQEYTWVTRDYVESDSGNYYYVNHDYDYVQSHGGDRLTYYTKSVSEATSLTTYKQEAGTYLYDGWYQVNPDGTETPYTFGELITGNTKIRLHWKKSGTYYLKYNTDVTIDGERLIGTLSEDSVLPDTDGYRDQAVIRIGGRAVAPEGFAFVGWTIRGDDSGKVYYPGEEFKLLGEHAVTVNGKKTVYLDAVYKQIKTAKIVYDANGGTITADADGGYPYEIDSNRQPVLDGDVPKNLNTHTVTRDSEKDTVTVSGLVNNSPVKLSSGEGFAAPSGSHAVLSGWNTKEDGSGDHYDIGAYTKDGDPICVDTKDPVTLYAEWKINVYFNKNDDNASFSGSWEGYTLVEDSTDPHYGDYFIEKYINATLKEPDGTVTKEGTSFDFWSKKSGGDQSDAFSFNDEKLTGETTLYAHYNEAVKIPYHVASINKVKRDSWRKTDKLRVTTTGLDLTSDGVLSDYVKADDGYSYSYACLSQSESNISEDNKIIKVRVDGDKVMATTAGGDDIVLDSSGQAPGGRYIYLVYTTVNTDDRVKLAYVREGEGGALSNVAGVGSEITYDGSVFNSLNSELVTKEVLNSATVANGSIDGSTVSGQVITLGEAPLEISQTVGADAFNAPPLLDDRDKTLALIYDAFGVSNSEQAAGNISEIVGSSKKLYLRYYDGKRQWSGDKTNWTTFTGDALYVVYRPRGVELEITKSIMGDNTGISEDESFAVKIESTAITRTSYAVEGTGYSTVPATPASGETPGSIDLTVKDGSDIRISGLGSGNYTITETHSSNYILNARIDNVEAEVTDNKSVSVELDTSKKVDLLNQPEIICRILDTSSGGYKRFYTLNKALEYAGTKMDGTAVIEMMRDYAMPSWDVLEIPTGYDITLTSAAGNKTITRAADTAASASAMLTNYGTLTLKNITFDGENTDSRNSMIRNSGALVIDSGATLTKAKRNQGSGSAIYQNDGSLTIKDGASFTDNSTTVGGAIYVYSGTVNIGGGTFSGNTAANDGGALYYAGSDTVTVSGGTFSGNHAASSNGGAIYAPGGYISISGGTFRGNTAANGNGGAICSDSGEVSITGGTIGGSGEGAANTAKNGGAVYSDTGEVIVDGGTLSGNAASGNGGAICSNAGTVAISKGTLSGNAASGYGGAVYSGGGSFEMSGGTIGGSGDGAANTAKNGAAVYKNTESATFTGGTITGNTATEGGAVGVGSADVRLYFSGNVSVSGNTKGENKSNVYLDQDADNVINIAGLGNNASIGVHVADSVLTTRGVPGAKFATYTEDTNKVKITNDRDDFSVVSETSAKKLFWGKAINVIVRYQKTSFADQLPPAWTKTGDNYKAVTINNYYPVMGDDGYVAISALAEDLYTSRASELAPLGLSDTAAYGGSWLLDTSFGDYVTKLTWNAGSKAWELTKHDNTTIVPLGENDLIVYYAEPAYISIENNTDKQLTISGLTLKVGEENKSVINTADAAGYGMVYAKNGAICSALLPVESGDLVLAANKAISLLIPGGRDMEYSLTGTFDRTGDPVKLRTTKSTGSGYDTEYLTLDGSGGFTFPTGKKTLNKAGTYQLIFGDDKMICKIYTDEISNVDADDYLVCTPPDTENKVEYVFKSLNQATEFVEKYMSASKTATIEMLIDYLLPASDNMNVQQGYDITLTTAESGTYKYTPDPEYPDEKRATISRDSENKDPLVAVASGNNNTFLTIDKIIIDGKSVQGSTKDGAVSVKNAGLTVRDSAFKNVYAGNGGAIFAECDQNQTNSWVKVYDSDFTNCHSTKTGSRDGGGAIHAYVNCMELDNCHFETCDADWQAGAVFHKVENNNKYTESYVKDCTFTNCRSKAAGGLELGSRNIIVMGCEFTNCVATSRNGGGFNVYALKSGEPSADCWTTVIDCKFNDCHNTGTDGGRGGGFRCTSKYTTIINTDFTNTSATIGGAVALSSKNAVSLDIHGGTIDGGVASDSGGAVYSIAKILNVGGSYTYREDESGKPIIYKDGKRIDGKTGETTQTEVNYHTTIKNCTAKNAGGGIYYDNSNNGSEINITDTTIQKCVSTNSTGGGVRTNARSATVTGSAIMDNRAKGNGGGICDNANSDSYMLTVDSTEISGNVSGGMGGGIYTDSRLTLRNDTMITENRLSTTKEGNGGGVYIYRKLIVGTENAEKPDSTTVKNNSTASVTASDLRLKAKNDGTAAADSVDVLCSLKGEIRVVNPGAPGEKFGDRKNENIEGFTEGKHVFVADSGKTYGVYDRNKPLELIWRGSAICKLTDASGHLLYLDKACTDPAVFDRLDYRSDGNKISPFSYLRQATENITLYRKGESSPVDLTDEEIQIRMLVGTFESATYITTTPDGQNYSGRKLLTLTTAGSTDTDGYPYTGRAGSYATVTKGYTDNTGKSFIKTGINLTLKNITLDGGSADRTSPKTSTANGGLINATTSGTTVTLSSNAVLQNCSITSNNSGAGVYVDSGASLVIAGGALYNCSTAGGNGGAVYKSGDGGKLEFTSGIISNCSALNGGGVYYLKGNDGFVMSGTAQITGCTAANEGGGVWLNEQKKMTMNGGSITGNHAGTAGGGVFLKYHKNSRLDLSGRVTVSGNTCGDPGSEFACNVQLGTAGNNPGSDSQGRNEWNGIINSKGISRNSYIGIYVPGEETPGEDPNTTVFDRHGIKEKPFGTYTGDTNYLYCFVNDRNGLKGGLMTTDKHHYIYWVEIFSLKVGKTVISGESYDLAESFTFKVTFSASEGGPGIYDFGDDLYFYYDDGRTDEHGEPITIPITKGVATFTLKNGDKVTVDNLPAEYDNGHVYYSVEEVLSTDRAKHYTTTTSRSTNPSATNDLTVKGIIGENLDRTDVSSKYISNAFFDNLNAICKLTSSKNGGVLLNTLDTVSGNFVPAIYTSLSGGSGAFDVINASTPLYYWNAFTNKYEQFNYSGSDILSVEMLIEEHTLPAAVTLTGGKAATFTTASRNARDGYPYLGSGTTASIFRGNNFKTYMFTANGALTLKNICLDGKNINANNGIVNVPAKGSLTVADGATLQNNVNISSNGGAVYVSGSMTMTGGIIKSNKTTKWGGGAIRIENNGNVTISGGEISNNIVQSDDVNGGAVSVKQGTLTVTGNAVIRNNEIKNNETVGEKTKAFGGAIYAEGTSKVYLSGGAISGNTITSNLPNDRKGGPGICMGGSAVLYLSGNPVFGSGTNANTLVLTDYSDKKNGNESVYENNIVRQDIYLSETADNPASLVINGNLTGEPGSIWVWETSEKHFKTMTPFAKINTNVVTITDANRDSVGEMFKVFRNARHDGETENPRSQNPAYLYGVLKADDNDYVYWYGVEGSRRVILRKVKGKADGSFEPKSNMQFTISKDTSAPYTAYEIGGVKLTGDALKSRSSGIIWIGELPYGTYTVIEGSNLTDPSDENLFTIEVSEDGIKDSRGKINRKIRHNGSN